MRYKYYCSGYERRPRGDERRARREIFYFGDVRIVRRSHHIAKLLERSIKELSRKHETNTENDDDPLEKREAKEPRSNYGECRAHNVEPEIRLLAPADLDSLECVLEAM